jgi:SAM-dependent methyltransferase
MQADCRFCGAPLHHIAADFGDQPFANALVPMAAPAAPDPRYPLRVMVCGSCLLVQLEHAADPALLFSDYAYLSSVSTHWLDHAARFAAMATDRFQLNRSSLVLEVGSNDGYLLRAFLGRGLRGLGVEPAANIAAAARAAGIPTRTAFFGARTAAGLRQEVGPADLLVANNVLAHAPALRDFVAGLAHMLAPGGVLSIEVPHVLAMLQGAQFDTVYHEHVFYFSARVLQRVLAAAGLAIFDLERLHTHGGSLRVLAQHAATGRQPGTGALAAVLAAEDAAGLGDPARYASLAAAAASVVADLRAFAAHARAQGAVVAAYGAAAKGTMLLNAAQIGPADLPFVVDANPLKQGQRLPGCRIPILPPEHLRAARPDFLVLLPWNIADEIMAATRFIAGWGGRFVVPLPHLRIIPA